MDERSATPEELPDLELRQLRALDLEEPPAEGMPAHVASASGIARRGDFIYQLDRTPVVNKGQFNRTIARKTPGTKVEIGFIRDGKEYSIEAEVAVETGARGAPRAN